MNMLLYRAKAVLIILMWPLIAAAVWVWLFLRQQPKAISEWWYLSNPGMGLRGGYEFLWARFMAGRPQP